mmetsp:Transcript_113592/g.197368  ORF Transcript_113592/g.197368 Transcript_113592/m.197368 type:complete len:234 (+) Transcript_113592:1085-1786(+)
MGVLLVAPSEAQEDGIDLLKINAPGCIKVPIVVHLNQFRCPCLLLLSSEVCLIRLHHRPRVHCRETGLHFKGFVRWRLRITCRYSSEVRRRRWLDPLVERHIQYILAIVNQRDGEADVALATAPVDGLPHPDLSTPFQIPDIKLHGTDGLGAEDVMVVHLEEDSSCSGWVNGNAETLVKVRVQGVPLYPCGCCVLAHNHPNEGVHSPSIHIVWQVASANDGHIDMRRRLLWLS